MASSKYSGLALHLSGVPASTWRARFSDIEKVLGFPLPESARQHRAWWSNNGSNNVMTKVWKSAGWETEQVDMENQVLVFRKLSGARSPAPTGGASPALGRSVAKLRDAAGTQGFAFGRLKGTVTQSGDLSEPTGETWNAEQGRL